jgi:hypothetical protein
LPGVHLGKQRISLNPAEGHRLRRGQVAYPTTSAQPPDLRPAYVLIALAIALVAILLVIAGVLFAPR